MPGHGGHDGVAFGPRGFRPPALPYVVAGEGALQVAHAPDSSLPDLDGQGESPTVDPAAPGLEVGGEPLVQKFPGSERAPTLAEVQEIQRRLTSLGFDTGGTDGRVGNDTMKAVKDYQARMGLLPADGYGGLKVLARLRQGG